MPKKINEIGNRYGRLVVIREATKEEKGNLKGGAYWWCQCDCGTLKMINGHSLRDGSTKSCGCLNKEIVSNNSRKKLIDLTGQKFGKLTVIKRDVSVLSKESYWICNCDCGKNNISILGKSLRDGSTKSCGCIQKEIASKSLSDTSSNNYINEIGNTYGLLTVINKSEEHFETDLEGVYYNCICLCGNNKHIRARGIDLRNGHISSCGCLKSKGENKIKDILIKNKINFKREFKFNDLYITNEKYLLRFDFGITDSIGNLEYLIEYQGKQHYEPFDYFGGEEYFKKIKHYDNIKLQYCKNNNIPLIIIPYWHYKNLKIDDLLLKTSIFKAP